MTGPIALLRRQKILKIANTYFGTNTLSKFHARDACAYSVTDILEQAGIVLLSPSGASLTKIAWVPDLTAAMIKAGAQLVTQSQALAGDIAVQDYSGKGPGGGQNHIGICMSDGCNVVSSNSTSYGTFTSTSDPTFNILNPTGYPSNLTPGFLHFP